MMFPDISNIDIQTNINENIEKKYIGKSYLFDFEKGEFVIRDGKLVEVEGIESVKVWIAKIIHTQKGRFKIYKKEIQGLEYGVKLEDLIIGHNYPQNFVESEIKREITAALIKHPLIDSLSNWKVQKNNPLVKISFTVHLKDGNSFDKEVNI